VVEQCNRMNKCSSAVAMCAMASSATY
jgi:hypothetical protein